MTFEDKKITICEHLDSVLERFCCKYCKHPAEYKDPDDCMKAHCDTCKLWEALEEVKEEIDEL